MNLSPGFLRFAAICAMLTALTTIVIHWLPEVWAFADTFEEQLELRNNPLYLTHRWVVLVHCVLVVISMYAIGIRRIREMPALIGLGFLGFVVFAFTEILRTTIVIFGVNRTWREGFVNATDEQAKEAFRHALAMFPAFNAALFFIFITGFVFGLACYGFALVKRHGLERKIGFLFLFWAAVSLPGLIDEITGRHFFDPYFAWVGLYFIALARALIGIWMWTLSSQPGETTGPTNLRA